MCVGGHPNVDDDHVGLLRADQGEELASVSGLAYHVEPGFAQQVGHALAEWDGVVGECYAHGSVAVIRVPFPTRLSMWSTPE